MRYPAVILLIFLFVSANAQRTPQIELSLSIDTAGNCVSVLKGKFYGILYIEQFRWNRWCPVDTLGDQSWIDTSIRSKVLFHSGENQFRVVAIPANPYLTSVRSGVAKTTSSGKCHTVSRCNGQYLFGCNTYWEVTRMDGTILNHGYGEKVDLMNYPSGLYYLNYDNSTLQFYGNRQKD